MPFLIAHDLQMADVLDGVRARRVIDQGRGSGALTLGELEIEPGAGLPMHRHKVEEVIVVLEGTGTISLDDSMTSAEPGTVLLAPAGKNHGVNNTGPVVLRILLAFPAVNVERFWAP